ncbi:MAG: c-type cytochrome [Sulfitobacter sp.]
MLTRTLITVGFGAALVTACTSSAAINHRAIKHGQGIYLKECAQCHGITGEGGGAASLGLGDAPPNLTMLSAGNGGVFPHEFVRRYVLGLIEKTDPDAAMPEFAKTGLSHVYPNGGSDGESLEVDFTDLLDYLETLQK